MKQDFLLTQYEMPAHDEIVNFYIKMTKSKYRSQIRQMVYLLREYRLSKHLEIRDVLKGIGGKGYTFRRSKSDKYLAIENLERELTLDTLLKVSAYLRVPLKVFFSHTFDYMKIIENRENKNKEELKPLDLEKYRKEKKLFQKALGEQLKKLREKEELTQQSFAESQSFELTQQLYAKYEQGILLPPIESLLKIADFYRAKIDSIIEPSLKKVEIIQYKKYEDGS